MSELLALLVVGGIIMLAGIALGNWISRRKW